MARAVFRRFKLVTSGKSPEIDRLGVMIECLAECSDPAEVERVLTYLMSRFRSQCMADFRRADSADPQRSITNRDN